MSAKSTILEFSSGCQWIPRKWWQQLRLGSPCACAGGKDDGNYKLPQANTDVSFRNPGAANAVEVGIQKSVSTNNALFCQLPPRPTHKNRIIPKRSHRIFLTFSEAAAGPLTGIPLGGEVGTDSKMCPWHAMPAYCLQGGKAYRAM